MTVVLTRSDILQMINYPDVVDAVEKIHASLSAGSAAQPAPKAVTLPGSDAVFLPMTGLSASSMVVKLLADLPGVGQRSTIMITDAATGACEAILDGGVITAFRTAAASAVATRHLARPESRVLGLIGAGAQAHAHALAIRAVLPVTEVVIWNRTPARALSLAAALADSSDLSVRVEHSIEAVTSNVDVLCTLTPSRAPIISGSWFRPGLHVNAVGAPPRRDHREIDSEGVRRSRVVVDSHATALEKSGDVMIPVDEGVITPDHFARELGDVVTGRCVGRRSSDEITLYNSVGVGLQDLATARLMIDRALAEGLGTHIDLSR
ncbi:ornithine cyclodeaminase [Actinoplanes sp. OR16]|uniref:ornithine cyclodeaminase family protein n=1 Tax=Actinoplanes sp. OR16 TaxID=946334 RepID=UPI000F6F337B|nr:ornithine cyclodeaminase family protein [Actinoplanes sp. OR16]BBH69080.1 ornithine cyclodeaminase [Actinoplanes sp. OR16]